MQVVTPASEGIHAKAITALINELEAKRLDMHSLLVMRHGNLVSETYWSPYTQKSLQRMYSVTKSFVSMAVGILASEGKLHLDDPICAYFPEKLDGKPQKELQETTIRDMLAMESCHQKTTYKLTDSPDWVGSFFTVRPDHHPGDLFMYDTSATHVLGALVEKLSGMELLDFLRTNMLDKVGFSKDAYTLKDPMGVTIGGSGLVCTSRDLIAAARAFADPASPYHAYFQQASRKQVDTWPGAAGGIEDLQQGYGYYVWRTTHDGYCFYGMGGQLAVFVPARDLIIVTTAWVKHVAGGLQQLFDSLWRFVDSLKDEPVNEEPEALDALRETERTRSLLLPPGTGKGIERALGTYTLGENGTGIREITVEKQGTTIVLKVNGSYRGIAGIASYQVAPFAFNGGWQAASCVTMDMQGTLRFHSRILAPEVGDLTILLAPCSIRVTYCVEPKLPVGQGMASASFSPENRAFGWDCPIPVR